MTLPLVKIRNLMKMYKSPDNILQNIIDIEKIDILEGNLYCLKGDRGSGKTTLLNIIAGILLPDSGKVLIKDVDITKLTERQRDSLRVQNIGYIFQNFNLLQGFTVLENVLLAMHFNSKVDINSKNKAKDLLAKVGLKTRLDYQPKQLSFGQQQRVAIARALVNNPGIILADEPTGSLDKKNTAEIIALIKELSKENNTTLLFATHDPKLIDEFDNHIQL